MIDPQQFDQLVIQRLPTLVRQNPQIRELVLELAKEKFADRQETDDRFYQLLGELKRDREEQARKWDEQNRKDARKWEEQTKKWEEQTKKWEEQTQKWNEQDRKWHETQEEFKGVHEEIKAMMAKQDRSISAIGARWGVQPEASFRNALAAILEKSFGVQVLNVNEYDDEGTVFGRPDQVELDVIIKNGLLIICEIKSSIDKAGMYTFERKVRFYEKRHQRTASRMIVISPMVDLRARPVAEKLGIEVYSDSVDVKTEL
jgi:hypothetical protein